MRRGAQWALGVGASLFAMAAGAALTRKSAPSIWMNAPQPAFPRRPMTRLPLRTIRADITLSLPGGGGTEGASGARPDLIFNPEPCRRFWSADCHPQSRTSAAQTPRQSRRLALRLFRGGHRRSALRRRAGIHDGLLHPLAHQPAPRLSVGQQRLFWAAVRRYSLPSRPPRLR